VGAKEKIAAYLREKLGDDVFTPDVIEGLNDLDIDDEVDTNSDASDNDSVDIDAKIEAAINDALEKSNAEWSERYRKTFFGEKVEQPEPESTDVDDGEMATITLDSIFNESE
jgi:hypothetical protein